MINATTRERRLLICVLIVGIEMCFYSWERWLSSKFTNVSSLRTQQRVISLTCTYQWYFNTWNPLCIHYLLLCQTNLRQAFRLSGTTFVKMVCVQLVNKSISIIFHFKRIFFFLSKKPSICDPNQRSVIHSFIYPFKVLIHSIHMEPVFLLPSHCTSLLSCGS